MERIMYNSVMYRWVFMGDYACKTIGYKKDLKEFLTDWNEENSTSYDDWKEFNENEEWYCIVTDNGGNAYEKGNV